VLLVVDDYPNAIVGKQLWASLAMTRHCRGPVSDEKLAVSRGSNFHVVAGVLRAVFFPARRLSGMKLICEEFIDKGGFGKSADIFGRCPQVCFSFC
jgi:hypothetical protein